MEFLKKKATTYTLQFFILFGLVLLLNLAFRFVIVRWDMTEENRYSMNESTQRLLRELQETVYVEVYLAGEINPEFARLQTAIQQTLEQFKTYSFGNVQYKFVDPDQAETAKSRNQYYRFLIDKGIQPTTVFDTKEGSKTQKLIFPGAELTYRGKSLPVILLNANSAVGAREAINQSIENLEYQLASSIKSLTTVQRKKVALVQGHGEPTGKSLNGLERVVAEKYDLIPLEELSRLDQFDAALFIKPTADFSGEELFDIDQFIMNGGKSLFFLDGLLMDIDSIREFGAMALPVHTGLEEILFKYGVRVNNDVLQDVSSGNFPIVTGNLGANPQVQLLPWPYYPILNTYNKKHPIVKNLNAVYGKFVSSIDTFPVAGVKKTPLIFTSDYTRRLKGPILIDFEGLKKELVPENFALENVPVTYLLEGDFSSAYANRLAPENREDRPVRKQALANSMIVASDGDLLLSEIDRKSGEPFPLGIDPYAQYASNFANDQLIMNMLNYLLDEDQLIIAKNKELKIRPIDKVKLSENKLIIQVLNVLMPILLIVLFGTIRFYWRKGKYGKFKS